MIFIRILSIITLIGSMAWLIFAPGFEPVLALIGSISAIISTFFIEGKNSKEEIMPQNIQQSQSVSKSSTGIQAGGDIKIGDERSDKNVK